MTSQIPSTCSFASTRASLRWYHLLLPAFLVVVRCVFASVTELHSDEAYYWVWSRSLAGGYFDHPPLVAALIRLSTEAFGHSEFAVRLPAALLGGGTLLAGTLLASLLGAAGRTLLAVQVALFAFPMLHALGAIITPDTPAAFFVVLALVAGTMCHRDSGRGLWWIALGTTCGLAMLSKYTAAIPCLVMLAMLAAAVSVWRAVMAGLLALLIFSPVLLWNYQHDWISFRFQLAHGLASDDRHALSNVGEYLGGILLSATPVLAVLMLHRGATSVRSQEFARRLIATTSLATLAAFLLSSFRHKVELNWPILAWIPLLVLLVVACDWDRPSRYRRWIGVGVCIAAFGSFLLLLPPAVHARIARGLPTTRTEGWSELAARLHAAAGDRPIACVRYQDAAIFSFYMPGQPYIPVLRDPRSRPSQYDLKPPAFGGSAVFLISDGPFTRGPQVRTSGDSTYRLEVMRTGEQTLDLDGLQRRYRAYAFCRYDGRDVNREYRYSSLIP